MSWWPFKKKKVFQVQIVQRDVLKVRLKEFRSNKALVGTANKLLQTAELRMMLDCVYNEHPGFWVLQPGATELDRIRAQCLAEGYTMALANFESLGNFVELTEMPEPTFEPEEREQTK